MTAKYHKPRVSYDTVKRCKSLDEFIVEEEEEVQDAEPRKE